MVDATTPNAAERIETRKDLGTDEAGVFAYWQAQEAIAEKEERRWIKRSRQIVKRYRDERPENTESQPSKFNILWSNVQTLIPTLYGRTPKPDVQRRFLDPDPAGRLASILMERSLSYFLDTAHSDFDDIMEAVVEDRLLPGRGVARVLYVPHFGEPIKSDDADEADAARQTEDAADFEEEETDAAVIEHSPDEVEAGKGETDREVTFEKVVADYVYWEDYREGPARKWKEVPWVRYQAYLTRDELVDRFGSKKGKAVNLDFTPKGNVESAKDNPPADLYKKAIVREYWDKIKRRVIWIAPGTPDVVLDSMDDPLRLPDFFPNPNPLRSTTTNDKRTPVPDYDEYRDQAKELDTLTARIDKLTKALKISGVYPGEDKAVLQQLIDEGTENRLIPVADWPAWSEKGGLQNFIQYTPLKEIAETLIQLYTARDKVKALLYEITGIGDIMRGMTEPDETYGAQQLKANFSTRRITPQQKKVAKFSRDLLRLMAGVIAEHFSPKTISMITGYPQLQPVPQLPPKPQQFIPNPAWRPPQPQLMAPPIAPQSLARPRTNGLRPHRFDARRHAQWRDRHAG